MSATIARFSSSVVRSASRTCRTSDLATRHTTGVSASSSARTCGSSSTRTPALRVAPNATSWACRSVELGAGAGEELGVLGQRARPAALDEADADLVQQPGDGELVGDGVADALALGAVAQGGVEDVEVRSVVATGSPGWSVLRPDTKKTPRVREVCAQSGRGLRARLMMIVRVASIADE